MKRFNSYIQEKLVLNSDTKLRKVTPVSKAELKKIIDDKIQENPNSDTLVLNNVDVFNITNMNRLFRDYNHLKYIDISNWKVSQVTSMTFMFPSSLEKINLSKWDVENVKNMSSMFSGCKNLKNVDISDWDVKNLENCNEMFCDCLSLEEVDLSYWNPQKLRSCEDMFTNCKNLKNVGNIENWKVGSHNNMFLKCINLKNKPSWY